MSLLRRQFAMILLVEAPDGAESQPTRGVPSTFVHRETSALATHKVNITNLVSQLVGGMYTMVLDVDLPNDLDDTQIVSELDILANELRLDIKFRPSEASEL